MSEYKQDSLLVQYADDTQMILNGSINKLEALIKTAEVAPSQCKCYF